jgi:hypothetical protein
MRQPQTHLSRLFNRWKALLVGNVPDDLAACEFDCRKYQCAQGEWTNCDRRIAQERCELSPMPKEPRTTA